MKLALSVFVALALVVGFAGAEDKKSDAVTVSGKICCPKCELKKESKCGTCVVVKEGNAEVIYYFDAKSNKEYHKEICTSVKEGKVTGKVTEKDGKKTITVTKVEFKE
jgi:hypothetical protein